MRLPIALSLAAIVLAALPAAAQDAPEADPLPEAMELPLRSSQLYAVPPRFAYPQAALREGLDGACMVSFTVDAAGVPQDIRADCSHPLFTAAARDGVAAMRLRIGGTIAPGGQFRLPVSFRIPL